MVTGVLMTLNADAQVLTLPKVYKEQQADFISVNLKDKAKKAHDRLRFAAIEASAWEETKETLKNQIRLKAGINVDHELPLELRETGRVQSDGFHIKNIRFQTRPGVYATASLYVPDAAGTFPAVVVTHGHWPDARSAEIFQSVAQVLAGSGYVALVIDAWGTGERCSVEGTQEYHGANLGASLLNVGHSLLGMQVTDNIRAVDLLSSLPYVDKHNIGATGASGGGNQTMWLAALDERIKAAVPVVSVGTFQSYILNSNCICELLPDGLSFTEEGAVLGLVAPRALKILNAGNDANKAFHPTEMLKSYGQAEQVFEAYSAKDKLSYQIFDTGHGYWPEMREAMLGWFNQQLKGSGNGNAVKEPVIKILPAALLATYPAHQREKEVMTTAEFCKVQGEVLNKQLLNRTEFDPAAKLEALKKILAISDDREIKTVHPLGEENGWLKFSMENSTGDRIPFLLKRPANGTKRYTLLSHSAGKDSIPALHLKKLMERGEGLVLIDVWGTGEQSSAEALKIDGTLPAFHTLSRSALWLGSTVMGIWVQDMQLISNWLLQEDDENVISVQGYKETGIASLFYAVLNQTLRVSLYDTPYSYRFQQREGIDFYNMAIHIPGILNWGDISMASALSDAAIVFVNARNTAGIRPDKKQLTALKAEFDKLSQHTKKKKAVHFIGKE